MTFRYVQSVSSVRNYCLRQPTPWHVFEVALSNVCGRRHCSTLAKRRVRRRARTLKSRDGQINLAVTRGDDGHRRTNTCHFYAATSRDVKPASKAKKQTRSVGRLVLDSIEADFCYQISLFCSVFQAVLQECAQKHCFHDPPNFCEICRQFVKFCKFNSMAF